MSVRNLKDGSKNPWLCECYPNGRTGKRVRKRFTTKGEATAYEKFIMREIDDKPWMGDKPDHRRLSEIISIWYKYHGKNLKSGGNVLGRMNHIVDALNDPIAAHITTKSLANYRSNRVNKGRGRTGNDMSISSNNYDISWLKSIFNRLIKLKEWRLPNPVDGIEPIKQSESELTFLHTSQIIYLFECIKNSFVHDELRLIFKICLSTGARISEAVNLKSDHIFDCKVTFVNTKGKRNRTLPISDELYNELQQMSQNQAGRLFTCGYGVTYKWITKALPDLPSGQATHVLRHTFATTFMRNGGNILDLKNALGHVNIDQTMVYAHFSPDHLSSVVSLNPVVGLKI